MMPEDDPDDEAPPFEVLDANIAETPTESVADPKAQRKKKRTIKQRELASEEFWKAIFSTEDGRREMWGILAACHTFEQVFGTSPQGFPNTEATCYHNGERDVGQRLFLTWSQKDPVGVQQMLIENDPRFLGRGSRRGQ